MRGNTFVMLLVALIAGVAAIFAANMWLAGQQRAARNVPVANKIETETIVVAAKNLSYGEPLRPELLREIAWPKAGIPEGAFAKISDLTADGTHVVLSPISPNEPVLKWKISGAGARASLSATLEAGMRAVAVRINDVNGVAGFVLPGDHVDVLYTRNGSGQRDGSTTDILMQDIRVLAINQVADQKRSDPVVGTVATVEVTAIDAQKLALAQSTGTVSLTLRAAGSRDPAPAQRVVEQELVSSPSAYQTTFDQQAAAQAALDARLKGVETSLTDVQKQVQASDSSKEQLARQLADLAETVQKTAQATGAGEDALRAKLADLEAAIKATGDGKGLDEQALRDRLAGFEANLRDLAAASNKPSVITVAATPQPAPEVKPQTVTVGVTRALKRETYVVLQDASAPGAVGEGIAQ